MEDSIHTITAAILAGGLGTRLRETVPDRPKILAEVNGRPFLCHLLDELHDGGIRDVVLCTGFLAEQVEETIGSRYKEMAVRYSLEKEPLGTGGALRNALPLLSSNIVLVANGDSLLRVDLRKHLAWHLLRESEASIVLAQVADASRFGRIEADESGRVLKFIEKDGLHVPGWINAGVYLLSRERIASIPGGYAVSLEREIFPGWIERGLHAMRVDSGFLDIGTPESYREAGGFFSAGN
jgi:D-glycero-alpha-D-manno-heptose 1-phosphate guanylyltransferase